MKAAAALLPQTGGRKSLLQEARQVERAIKLIELGLSLIHI